MNQVYVLLTAACLVTQVVGQSPPSFSQQIAPILQSQCVGCHGPMLAEGDYRTDSFARLMLTPASETTAVVPGEIETSELYKRLIATDDSVRMPAESDPLMPQQIQLIRDWIASGAAFDGDSVNTPLAQLQPEVTHPIPPREYPSSLPISALKFSRDGQQIYASGYHEITVWSIDGELLRRIQNQGERTYGIDLHPSEQWLLSASGTPGELGEVREFNAESGELHRVLIRTSEAIMAAQYSPDGTHLAIGMPDGSTRIVESETGNTVASLLGHSDQVAAVTWHVDGNRLATSSRDDTAKIFDWKLGRSVATFAGHTGSVNGVIFSNADSALSVSDDGTAQLWSIREGRKQREVLRRPGPLNSIVRGKVQYVISGAQMSQRFDVQGHQPNHDYRPDSAWVTAGTVHGPTDRVALGLLSGEVMIHHADTRLGRFVAKP